jgi:hypothetical protein
MTYFRVTPVWIRYSNYNVNPAGDPWNSTRGDSGRRHDA